MTIASPETAGPNITSGSEIKFSTLRKYFLKMKPRSSFTDSDTFEPETGPVSASQLLRVSSLDSIDDRPIDELTGNRRKIEEEYELDSRYLLPYVPDCTENSNIATENNWKTSQFVGSIKYYYLGQSTTDDLNTYYLGQSTTDDLNTHDLNLDLTSQSWNNNLPLTIRKWFFVDGIIGSNTNTDGTKSLASLIISSTANYLSLKLSSNGGIYGSAGAAGTNGVNEGRGGDGGDAISWIDDNSSYNNYVILDPDSRLYGGGGGGGKGGDGGKGGTGGFGGRHNIGCNGVGAGGYDCTQNGHGGGAGGGTSIGPNGPAGRGYSNLKGLIRAISGGYSNSGHGGGSQVGDEGRGGDSGTNGDSGSAGDFGEPGNETPSTDGTDGSAGGTGSLLGECTICGGNNLGHHNRCCHSMGTSAQGGEQSGTSGAGGGSAGKAILKGTTTSITVVGKVLGNIKGDY